MYLILIIVESFNSKVLELDEVNEVAPSIKKWSEDSTALYFPNIEAMTGHGGSSDGQFMINTGILPLQAEALVSRYADADYPSLAKILGYNSIEVIGENRSVWSHYLTTKSYGYDRLVDNILPNKTPIAIQDSLIFAKAKDEIKNMVQPFFVQITTIGMHKPYTRDTGVTINLNNDYPISDRHYFEAVYTFDKNCGNFIEELKKLGIYEKSVIVIVADHEESMPELSETFNEKRIPMLILNSSLSCNEKYTDGRYRQIDIFPTILDVMGRSDSIYFRGVGKSMLRAESKTDISIEKAFEISEKLIKSEELRDSINHIFNGFHK